MVVIISVHKYSSQYYVMQVQEDSKVISQLELFCEHDEGIHSIGERKDPRGNTRFIEEVHNLKAAETKLWGYVKQRVADFTPQDKTAIIKFTYKGVSSKKEVAEAGKRLGDTFPFI